MSPVWKGRRITAGWGETALLLRIPRRAHQFRIPHIRLFWLPSSSVVRMVEARMTSETQGDQVLLGIIAALAAEFFVVNLQV
jgi:hypothetical protein